MVVRMSRDPTLAPQVYTVQQLLGLVVDDGPCQDLSTLKCCSQNPNAFRLHIMNNFILCESTPGPFRNCDVVHGLCQVCA